MARLDEYIFGYHRGKVAKEDTAKLVNTCLRGGISTEISPDGDFSLHSRDLEEFKKRARAEMRFEMSPPLGLFAALCRLRYCYGVIAALILSAFLFIFSSARVWDVRIEGNDSLSDTEIEAFLGSQGLSVGAKWREIDKNRLENSVLSENSGIAWLSVNRRGTVAYVQIIESENVGIKEEVGPAYSNIVAERDGVVEEITVESGVAVVKVGDVVRRGDVLISGVVENEKGVTFCRASGSVRATCVTNISSEATEKSTERVPVGHKLREIRLFIFDFSINIFKNYRNFDNGCDIIRENRTFALFDKFRLPLRIEKVYTAEYEERECTRSQDEMTKAAKHLLDEKMYAMFRGSDVIKLRTDASFSDGVYRITARVVYSTDIGKESAIELS